MAVRIWPLRGDYGQWILKREVQHGFRSQVDLLALCGRLYAATHSASGGSTDRGPLAAAGNAAYDRANRCTCAHLCSGILAAGTALAPVFIGLNGIRPASHGDSIQLQNQHRLSGKLASALHLYDMTLHVIARWNGDIALD